MQKRQKMAPHSLIFAVWSVNFRNLLLGNGELRCHIVDIEQHIGVLLQ